MRAQSAVSTTLPTITHALNGDDFVWVASAYGLAATALLPMSGALAEVRRIPAILRPRLTCGQIFGRRSSTLLWLSLFALGSALCGSAQNMNWPIAGRSTYDIRPFRLPLTARAAVQGAGGGGILSSTSILVSDLVPLNQRALYNSLNGLCVTLQSRNLAFRVAVPDTRPCAGRGASRPPSGPSSAARSPQTAPGAGSSVRAWRRRP